MKKMLVKIVVISVALITAWVSLGIFEIGSYNADPIGYPQFSDKLILLLMASLLAGAPVIGYKIFKTYQKDKLEFKERIMKDEVELINLKAELDRLSQPQNYSFAA